MQIYYFTRTGRSKEIAEQLASRYGIATRKIDDHRNWNGRIGYWKAALFSMLGKKVTVDFLKPEFDDMIVLVSPLWAGSLPPAVKVFAETVGKENIIAVITSLGSTLKRKEGFKKVIDLVGEEISAPDIDA